MEYMAQMEIRKKETAETRESGEESFFSAPSASPRLKLPSLLYRALRGLRGESYFDTNHGSTST